MFVDVPIAVQVIIFGLTFFIVLLALVALIQFVIRLRKMGKPTELHQPSLAIDVGKVPDHGPELSAVQLKFYSTPVRLAVLVIAPKGHSVQMPNNEQLQVLIERITPGMSQVIAEHQPTVCVWPAQMSDEGFFHSLFHNIKLPGDQGRGTPWCGVAGHFTVGMGSILVGMICVADSPNQLAQVAVQHEGQWRDVLRTG